MDVLNFSSGSKDSDVQNALTNDYPSEEQIFLKLTSNYCIETRKRFLDRLVLTTLFSLLYFTSLLVHFHYVSYHS